MTGQSTALRFADLLIKQPFSFPGGYPRYALTDDGGILCPDCCQAERLQIATSFPRDGWRVIGLSCVVDDSEPTICSHCSDLI